MFKKNKKLSVYYVVVVLFILFGFVVGRWEEEYDRGYEVYYGDAKPIKTLTGDIIYARDNEEIGDFNIEKNVGWYRMCFKSSDVYLSGDDIDTALVITYDLASELVAGDGANLLFDREDFEGVYYGIGEIIVSCIIWILLFVFPLIISGISKVKNKTSIKKNLKKLKELEDMKQQGLISEEQYNQRRKSLIEETKDKI